MSETPAATKSADRDGWIYGGVGGTAFSTVFGAGLVGIFYEHRPILGGVIVAIGLSGLVVMAILLRGHRLTVIHSAIAALFATWVFLGYVVFQTRDFSVENSEDIVPLPPLHARERQGAGDLQQLKSAPSVVRAYPKPNALRPYNNYIDNDLNSDRNHLASRQTALKTFFRMTNDEFSKPLYVTLSRKN